jgi:hypothetical protein
MDSFPKERRIILSQSLVLRAEEKLGVLASGTNTVCSQKFW